MRNNLIKLRHDLGFTQAEMGALVNKSKPYWANIEAGRLEGVADVWLTLGIKLNLTVQQIVKLKEVS